MCVCCLACFSNEPSILLHRLQMHPKIYTHECANMVAILLGHMFSTKHVRYGWLFKLNTGRGRCSYTFFNKNMAASTLQHKTAKLHFFDFEAFPFFAQFAEWSSKNTIPKNYFKIILHTLSNPTITTRWTLQIPLHVVLCSESSKQLSHYYTDYTHE